MKNWRKHDPAYTLERKKYPHPVPSRMFILATFKKVGRSLSFAALAKLFELNRGEKETLKHRVKAMLRDGELEERANGKLRVAKPRPTLIGKVFAHAEGYGFFIPEDKALTKGEDLFLSYSEMQQVMHGDVIEARILKNARKGKREGKVVRIIQHANKIVIGRLIDDYGIKVVKAENRRIHHKILVSNLADIEVKDNEIVEVTITAYPKNNQPILGKITKVLGDKMKAGMEIDIAIANYDLPHEWPDDVIKQTVAIPDVLAEEDYQGRVDLRHLPLVTIDGLSARDFDDAICAKATKNGYKLYVAIADVAHYVKKGTPIDREATNRATSVYFPNRVLPMLPEKLSNGLCSLNPQVDRLCLVCEMVIDFNGQLVRSQFYDAVMRSQARLTYETVEALLFSDKLSDQHELHAELSELLPSLQHLKTAYTILRRQRNERGAIDFETVEPEFEYDATGKLARMIPRINLQSHQLIEEFMVRANICAAKFLLKQKNKHKPIALFRNHQGPSEEKLDKLIATLAQEGIKLAKTETLTPKQLAAVVEQIKTRENFQTLQLSILRSMYQAVYQPTNEGHFGLALDHYAHFTSPIRRYPDLLVHRAIKHGLEHKNKLYIYSAEQMQQLGEHCSMAERRADEAVYDVIDYLKCEYMQDKQGQQFKAVISSVTSFGFFATLNEEFIDGLVHISTLDGDYFHFDEKRRVLVGERSRKVYALGDAIEIIVSEVSVDDRRIDFVLTAPYLPFGGQSPSSQKRRKSHKR